MKKLFVIIINFNSGEKGIELAKQLAGFQNVAGVIVVDNASTDGSLEKIRLLKSKKITIFKNQENKGFAAGVNRGAREAIERGAEKILLVNPDIRIFEKQVDDLIISENDIISPILTFSRGGRKVFDLGGKVNWFIGRATHIERIDLGPQRSEDRNRERDYISGACMLVRTGVFKKIGFFDERFFLYYEDVDFCHRAKLAGFSVAVNPKVVVAHQISEHRTTHDQFKMKLVLKSNFQFVNKWLPWPTKFIGWGYLALLAFVS